MMDFVTICYLPELSLLRLQARSLRLFYEGPCRLLVIWNSLQTSEIERLVEPVLAAELAGSEVQWRVVPAVAYIEADLLAAAPGRRTQQALKLLAARDVGRFYCVLDAKNHLIRNLHWGDLIKGVRHPITHHQKYVGSSFMPLLEGARTFMGLDDLDATDAMPTTTPYIMISAEVRGLIAFVEERTGLPMARAFLTSSKLEHVTEFLLYYAFLAKRHPDIAAVYAFGKPIYATIFRTGPSTREGMRRTLAAFNDNRIKVFGLHARRIPNMRPDDMTAVFQGWRKVGLIGDLEEAYGLFPNAPGSTPHP